MHASLYQSFGRHAKVVGKLIATGVAMFGFGYLMVPIYDILCEVTGLNGKTGRIDAYAARSLPIDESRSVTVQFTGMVNGQDAWRFEPTITSLEVIPGKTYTMTYRATNLRNESVAGQATPSVAPREASKHFNKAECFCFTRQLFAANETKDMPVTFVVEQDLPPQVDTLTLAYTFFRIEADG